ncbi:ABC transporter substrate-binding protein [Jonesia quinghaiensis]|uniref:ABC transporter substrate-binding protein n=1 Tax=Jonesia quinghaiensis TaxID=262806 RepID=UPI0003FA4E82|nr:ABC transporter substrate-binding protein [Jonesia quinghaiensis]
MRRHIAALSILSALLFTAACGGGATNENTPGTSGSDTPNTEALTLAQTDIPAAWDISGYASGTKTQYFTAVYDTILRQDGDGNIVAGVATDWSYNDERTELTLTVREGITFTDGEPLNAQAIVDNIEHFRASSTPDLSNAQFIDTATAPDATTVIITLTEPDPMMLNWLTQPLGYLSSPASWDSEDATTTPVGSGPYILDTGATVSGSTYVFTKNDEYWDDSIQQWDTLTFQYYADQTALLNALQGGQVDGASFTNVSSLPQVEAAGYTVNTSQLDWSGLMLLDRDGAIDEPLADVRVRQAINYALDRDGMLNALQLGYGSVTNQIFGPATSGYDEALNSHYSYDPDKARELLTEAGYGDGITLDMPSTSVIDSALLTQVQQQLSDVGITVNYTDVGTNFISDLMGAKYGSSWMQLAAASDWQIATFAITPTALFNPFGTEDPQVSQYLDTIQTGSEADAAQAAQELNTYIVDQAWFAPFYFIDNLYVAKPGIDVTMAADMVVPYMYLIQPAQ